jgi:hypothetical protein
MYGCETWSLTLKEKTLAEGLGEKYLGLIER